MTQTAADRLKEMLANDADRKAKERVDLEAAKEKAKDESQKRAERKAFFQNTFLPSLEAAITRNNPSFVEAGRNSISFQKTMEGASLVVAISAKSYRAVMGDVLLDGENVRLLTTKRGKTGPVAGPAFEDRPLANLDPLEIVADFVSAAIQVEKQDPMTIDSSDL